VIAQITGWFAGNKNCILVSSSVWCVEREIAAEAGIAGSVADRRVMILSTDICPEAYTTHNVA